jgi:L-asparaginase / beta-aspartyl-peptidase
MREPVLVVHGGAGTPRADEMTEARLAAYHAGLAAALEAGRAVLLAGGAALDAVTAAVVALEDDPLFNAGRGATLTAGGRIELDAAIMDGRDRRAGAVAGVTRARNPVLAARAVMETTPHLLLIGEVADALAATRGLAIVEPAYFVTAHRAAQLVEARAQATIALDHDLPAHQKFGTVGAVALDASGHLAAATSTGGMTNKWDGRVGDCPVIGAGTWADDSTVAVSCTGKGEAFIRCAAAHQVAVLVRHAGMTPQLAAEEIALREVPRMDGSGGLIVLDADGRVGMAFGTGGMFRGVVRGAGAVETAIF